MRDLGHDERGRRIHCISRMITWSGNFDYQIVLVEDYTQSFYFVIGKKWSKNGQRMPSENLGEFSSFEASLDRYHKYAIDK